MTCHEIEALRLGLMTVLGIENQAAREHAQAELEGHLDGPIEALATAESLAGIQRYLDAAIVDLEAEIAATDPDDPDYGYIRGRLVAVRDAELAVARLTEHGTGIFEGLDTAHHLLHETFPAEQS